MSIKFDKHFFDPYWIKKDLKAIKRDAERYRSLVDLMLDELKFEQQSRLRTIRETGPWEPDWEIAVRQQRERALQAIYQLKRFRRTQERIRELEETLPPTGGLNTLRYANPWIFTWTMAGLAILLNCWKYQVF